MVIYSLPLHYPEQRERGRADEGIMCSHLITNTYTSFHVLGGHQLANAMRGGGAQVAVAALMGGGGAGQTVDLLEDM